MHISQLRLHNCSNSSPAPQKTSYSAWVRKRLYKALWHVQVEALESVVAIQEEQLLQHCRRPSHTAAPTSPAALDTAAGQLPPSQDVSAETNSHTAAVVALLPRWRSETLRQHQLRLAAEQQVAAAQQEHAAERSELHRQLDAAHATAEVCCPVQQLCRAVSTVV